MNIVTCLPTSVGILLLERRLQERASKQLNVATHRARKTKIRLSGNLGNILFFLPQIFPCIMLCTFEGECSSQTAVTRIFFHGIPRPRSSFIFQFYTNRINLKESVLVYAQVIFA